VALDLGIVVAALATAVLIVSALLGQSGPGSTKEQPAPAEARMAVAGAPGAGSGAGAAERSSPAAQRSRARESPPSSTGLDREIRVQVENGCGVTGAAASLASALRRAGGFDVVEIGNAENFDFEVTVVVDRTGRGNAAREVARALGGAPIVRQRLQQTRFEVTVIVGYDKGRWSEPLAGARP
jgi:hypothetical protein